MAAASRMEKQGTEEQAGSEDGMFLAAPRGKADARLCRSAWRHDGHY